MSTTGTTADVNVNVAVDDNLELKHARVSQETASALDIKAGDPVAVKRGDILTVVEVIDVEDGDTSSITVDTYTGGALGIRQSGDAIVQTTDAAEGEEVVYENLSAISASVKDNINETDLRGGIKKQFRDKYVTPDDKLTVQAGGEQIRFKVASILPDSVDAVQVTNDTRITTNLMTNADMQSIDVDDVSGQHSGSDLTYGDLGGLHEEIRQVKELVERPLLDPDAFEGVSAPTGILLYGPPGTGKTMLANAAANEADVTVRTLTGSSIFSRYYGESEERLREIFDEARQNQPAIIFIDEFDSIAPSDTDGGKTESRVINQLKSLMDDIDNDDQIVILAATNDKDNVNEAFFRPGRFDRLIEVGVPDTEARREILEIHTADMPLRVPDSYIRSLAERTVGYTGADIKDICMKANLHMQRRLEADESYAEYESISDVLDNELEGHTKDDFENALAETQPTLLEKYDVDVPNIGWEDVGGHSDVISQLRAAVEGPLEAPRLWDDRERATGVLMYGPPGTGKTLLAKAMAGESNRTFIGVQSTELKSKYVGETERNIRRLFELAKQLQPSIVYIDEIETIARDRSSGSLGEEVQSAATSQLLSELDGIEGRGDVIVVGSTNAEYDPNVPLTQQDDVAFGLDPAMLRPGRLGNHFYIGLPDEAGRRQILDIHLNKVAESDAVALGTNIDRDRVVSETEGMSGAEIEAICWGAKEEAREALLGTRGSYSEIEPHEVLYVTDDHIEEAITKFKREE